MQVTFLVPFCWFIICMGEFFNHRIYLGYVLVLLFIERSICTICAYSGLFLVSNLYNSGQKIMSHIPDLIFWPVLILKIFSCWDIKKGQFPFLVTFLCVFSGQ